MGKNQPKKSENSLLWMENGEKVQAFQFTSAILSTPKMQSFSSQPQNRHKICCAHMKKAERKFSLLHQIFEAQKWKNTHFLVNNEM